MELALVASALFGVGVAYSRRAAAQATPPTPPQLTSRAALEPEAAGDLAERSLAAADAPAPTVAPLPATPSGRRDNTLVVDSSSLEERAQRFYNAPIGTKREVATDASALIPQPNVLVRSQTDVVRRQLQTMDRPVRMHGVNPVATTTGTAHQLVGPGINVGDALAGGDGFHYGMTRMMPNDVHVHQRGQRGGVIAGGAPIGRRPAELSLERKSVAVATFDERGMVAQAPPVEPLKYFAVSEEYAVAAPGRASATGLPGYGGARIDAMVAPTRRGAMVAEGVESGPGGVAVPAGDARGAQARTAAASIDTDRGRAIGASLFAPAQGPAQGGHAGAAPTYGLAPTERETTECLRGEQMLNAAAPGRGAMLVATQRARPTQTLGTLPVGHASGVGAAEGPGRAPGGDAPVRATQRLLSSEFRGGIAGVAGALAAGGHGAALGAQAASVLPTQRGQASEFVGAARGADAPMSYADVLRSEGYALRGDHAQTGFVAPGVSAAFAGATSEYDLRPAPANAAREGAGGVGNQWQANFHVAPRAVEPPPNKEVYFNTRLDPRILDALTRNELALAHVAA